MTVKSGLEGVLRSSYFTPDLYSGTELFLLYQGGRYVIQSRFMSFYQSAAVKPNTPKGRKALERAITKFENLLVEGK